VEPQGSCKRQKRIGNGGAMKRGIWIPGFQPEGKRGKDPKIQKMDPDKASGGGGKRKKVKTLKSFRGTWRWKKKSWVKFTHKTRSEARNGKQGERETFKTQWESAKEEDNRRKRPAGRQQLQEYEPRKNRRKKKND